MSSAKTSNKGNIARNKRASVKSRCIDGGDGRRGEQEVDWEGAFLRGDYGLKSRSGAAPSFDARTCKLRHGSTSRWPLQWERESQL